MSDYQHPIKTFLCGSKAAFVLLLVFFISLIHTLSFAQDISYAKHTVDTLCSSTFSGRGYVNNGQVLAGNYIENQMKALGLKPLPTLNRFGQPFKIKVNSFADSIVLSFNKTPLLAGVDYIIAPASRSFTSKKLQPKLVSSGNFLDVDFFSKKQKDCACIIQPENNSKEVVDDILNLYSKTSCQIFIKISREKLIWSVASESSQKPVFIVKEGVIPNKIKSISASVKSENKEVEIENIIGYIPGTTYKDSFIMVSAHYDHLGKMGQVLMPGANDNASGTAMLLDLASYFAKPENQHPYSLVFIAFAAEEAGLKGSTYFVENSPIQLSNIKKVVNLDLMGGGSEGIMVVNGIENPTFTQQLDSLNSSGKYLIKVSKRANAANSDHFPFTKKGVPAIFIYTLGDVTAYHDLNDNPNSLSYQHYIPTFSLIRKFIQTK